MEQKVLVFSQYFPIIVKKIVTDVHEPKKFDLQSRRINVSISESTSINWPQQLEHADKYDQKYLLLPH